MANVLLGFRQYTLLIYCAVTVNCHAKPKSVTSMYGMTVTFYC